MKSLMVVLAVLFFSGCAPAESDGGTHSIISSEGEYLGSVDPIDGRSVMFCLEKTVIIVDCEENGQED